MSEPQTTFKRKKAAINWGWKEGKEAFRAAPRVIKLVFWFSAVLGVFNTVAGFSNMDASLEWGHLAGPLSYNFVLFYAHAFGVIIVGMGSKSRWFVGSLLILHFGMYWAMNLFDQPNPLYVAAPWWPVQVIFAIVVFLGPLFLPSVSAYFAEIDAQRARDEMAKMQRYSKLLKW